MEEFFQTNAKSDYNHVLEKLQDYTLTEHNIQKSLIHFIDSITNKKGMTAEKYGNTVLQTKTSIKEKQKKEKNQIYVPKQIDTLFWCFYIIKNGFDNYNNIGTINIVIEKKLKIDCVSKIRENKVLLKKHKIASLTYIEDKLVNEKTIDIKTFFALCAIENLNVLYIYKNTFFQLNSILNINNSELYVIHRLDNYKFGYEEMNNNDSDEDDDASIDNTNKSKIDFYKNNFFEITNIDKPVKSMSYYKVNDLVENCKKLGIEYQSVNLKTKSKKELYEAFLQYF